MRGKKGLSEQNCGRESLKSGQKSRFTGCEHEFYINIPAKGLKMSEEVPKGEIQPWPAAQSGPMRVRLRHFFTSQPEMAKIVRFSHVAPLRKWQTIS